MWCPWKDVQCHLLYCRVMTFSDKVKKGQAAAPKLVGLDKWYEGEPGNADVTIPKLSLHTWKHSCTQHKDHSRYIHTHDECSEAFLSGGM